MGQRKQTWPKRIAVIIVLLFLLLGLLRIVDAYTYTVVPVQRFFYTTAKQINSWLLHFEELSKVQADNKLKQDQINRLLLENTELRIYREENSILREKLDFFETKLPDRSKTLARVIAQAINNPDNIIINKGSADGIIEGLPVIMGEGIMVGKISSVSERQSHVRLLRDLSSLVAVKILDKSNSSHLLTGKYGLSIIIELIPQNIELAQGDLVITAGIEEYIPQGLLVGQIESIETSPNDLFQSAIVRPAVSYDDISIVAVLLPDNN